MRLTSRFRQPGQHCRFSICQKGAKPRDVVQAWQVVRLDVSRKVAEERAEFSLREPKQSIVVNRVAVHHADEFTDRIIAFGRQLSIDGWRDRDPDLFQPHLRVTEILGGPSQFRFEDARLASFQCV